MRWRESLYDGQQGTKYVSEEASIVEFFRVFRTEMIGDKLRGLVWALSEQCLPNFLTPRHCSRVAYHAAG